MHKRMTSALAAVCAAGVALTSCAGQEPASNDEPAVAEGTDPAATEDGPGGAEESSAESPSGSAEDLAEETSDAFEDTPAGTQSHRIVELLNSEEDTDQGDWEDYLHPDFTEEVSAADLVTLVNANLRPAKPWEVSEYEGTDHQAVTTLVSEVAGELDMTVVVDDSEQITGLWFAPPSDREPAESLSEVEERLENLPHDIHALVQHEEAGEVTTLIDIGSSEAAPLASTAKLYVLLALVEAVESGDASWDDTVTVTEELRSLPSGVLQNEDEGSEITVLEAAQKMIEISDNTGTDLLIDYLGREAVEDAVATSGHHDPSLMQPFPSTRDIFQLRWDDEGMADRWEDGNEQDRREVLDELAEQDLTLEPADVTADDGWQRDMEWFASAEDILAVHEDLAGYAEDHAELYEILGSNTGVSVDEAQWEHVSFKGGSSPGVLTGSWHALDDDGDSLTVVLLATDEDAIALGSSQIEFFGLAEDTLALEY